MTVERKVTTKTIAIVSELVESVGDAISGRNPDDRHGLHEAFWGAFTHSLATSVHTAFIAKSELKADELGGRWPDLDPKTKAYSRPEGRKGLPLYDGKPTVAGNVSRPTLSKETDKAWRFMFVHRLAYFRLMMSEREAKAAASAQAWEYVKTHFGATTIIAYAKTRTMLLLQKSGRLEKSLRPGNLTDAGYAPPAEQVFKLDKSSLTWGTSVEYASRVSIKRPLWPSDIDVWLLRSVDAGIDAVVKKIKAAL